MKILICKWLHLFDKGLFYLSIRFFFSNFRQTCDQINGLDLSAWKSDEDYVDIEQSEETADIATTVAPLLEELNPELIQAAVERARETLLERKRFEYEAWLARTFSSYIY